MALDGSRKRKLEQYHLNCICIQTCMSDQIVNGNWGKTQRFQKLCPLVVIRRGWGGVRRHVDLSHLFKSIGNLLRTLSNWLGRRRNQPSLLSWSSSSSTTSGISMLPFDTWNKARAKRKRPVHDAGNGWKEERDEHGGRASSSSP